MATVAELNTKHNTYDAKEAAELWALYVAGEDLEKLTHVFLPKNPRENDQMYAHRVSCKEYRPYMASVIKYFSDMLFTSKPSAEALDRETGQQVTELDRYWANLKEDCTGSGLDLDEFFKQRAIEAMVKGKSWVAIRQPNDGLGAASSLLEHEQRKLGNCLLKALDFDDVYDWEVDDEGNLLEVIYHSLRLVRKGIASKRDNVIETWTHYTSDSIDTYRLEYKLDNKPHSDTVVPLIDSVPHSFGICPVVCMELSAGYHIAALVKSSQVSNYKLVSAQNFSLFSTCYAQPVAKVNDKDEFSEMIMGAGHGILIHPDEEFGWDAPPAAHYRALDTQIVASKDEIFRASFQMANGVENNVAAVGRTAESKRADAQSTRIALTSYGRVVKHAIERVYDTISSVRSDNYKWNIAGLDDFAAIDTFGLMDQALALNKFGGIHSRTWNAKFEQKIAESLGPDFDEQTKAIAKQEISEYVMTAPTKVEQELQVFAAQHAIVSGAENGKPTDGSGLIAPQSKPNATVNKGGTKKFSGPAPTKPGINGRQSEFVKAKKPGGK